MSSGPIMALRLKKNDDKHGNKAWKQWRELMGPTSREENKRQKYSDKIRHTYATDTTKNAVHGSDEGDGPNTTNIELSFFFGNNLKFKNSEAI